MAAYRRSARSRENRQAGETAEAIAKRALIAAGYLMVERVHTPWGVVRRGKRIVSAYPKSKVSGDFRAIGPGGLSVLAECKDRKNGKLSLSNFEDHQIEALDVHARLLGISLIAWVYNGKCKLLLWETYKPVHGKPFKWEDVKC